MKVSYSNEKLGKHVASISREVGPTCPKSCPLLNNGCYAGRLQNFRPRVLAAARANNHNREIPKFKKNTVAVRWNVLGDVLWKENLDRSYVALIMATHRHYKIPGWIYTHAPEKLAPHIKSLNRAGVQVFASTHSEQEEQEARAMGFRIARVSTERKKGYTGPKSFKVSGGPTIVTCPEQTGACPSCVDCGICYSPKIQTGVMFLEH